MLGYDKDILVLNCQHACFPSEAGLFGGKASQETPRFYFDKIGNKRLYFIFYENIKYWTGFNEMKYFLCVLGLVMIVEGLPYFAFPEKMKFWIQKIVATPEGSLRRFGFVLMILGLCLIYFGRT